MLQSYEFFMLRVNIQIKYLGIPATPYLRWEDPKHIMHLRTTVAVAEVPVPKTTFLF